jgi:light-regulated signal transduction histidine kinase (bacteriophytochrome)
MSAGTVLVVDDTDATRYTLVRLLNKAGYRTLEARDGADAIARADDQPDLVVLDVQLPDMLGFDVCRRIKAQSNPPKVLQTSASFIRGEDRATGLECGADAYLVQPLQASEFLATVQSLMRLRQTENALRQANEQLQRSNRNLEHFAHMVSHDLQEPLRTISSFLGVLEMRYADKLDERGRDYIGKATAGAMRLSAMIREFMERARAHRSGLTEVMVPTQTALADALTGLDLLIKESGARITAGELPDVLGDRHQLAQVFQNLLSNAIKFRSPARSLEVQITAQPDGDRWRIVVADNGIGIQPGARERIFGMFQRSPGSSDVPGMGIGLATIRSIIESHGGSVGVDSEPGAGSRFWFTLPRVRTAGSVASEQA